MFGSPVPAAVVPVGINNEKLKTFSQYLHETVSLFSGVIEEFNLLEKKQEHSNISTQTSALRVNNSTDLLCNHCEELQQIISSKDDMIKSVVSTLTKIIKTKDLNIVEDILKTLSSGTPRNSLDTCSIKSENSPESTPICLRDISNKSKSVLEDTRNNDSSVSEIEDTPGRKSPIIFSKKLNGRRTFIEPQSVSLKKKSNTNWTSPAKLIKLSSPTSSKLNRPNVRMRQTRLCITTARAENVVDLTASPDIKQEPGDDNHSTCNVKVEPMESEDAILPSPTSDPLKQLLFKSSKNTSHSSKLSLKKHAKSRSDIENKPAHRLDEEVTSDDDFRIDSPSKKDVSDLQFSSLHGMSLLEKVDDIETKALRKVNKLFQSELNNKIPLAENLNKMNIAGNTHNAGGKIKKEKSPSSHDDRVSSNIEEPKELNEPLVHVKVEQESSKEVTSKKDTKKYEPIYKELAPRKKAEKRALPGWSCEECKIFYNEMYKNNPDMLRKLMGECSKHRGRHNPVRPRTPPGFWEPRWNVADDTETFNRQNNAL